VEQRGRGGHGGVTSRGGGEQQDRERDHPAPSDDEREHVLPPGDQETEQRRDGQAGSDERQGDVQPRPPRARAERPRLGLELQVGVREDAGAEQHHVRGGRDRVGEDDARDPTSEPEAEEHDVDADRDRDGRHQHRREQDQLDGPLAPEPSRPEHPTRGDRHGERQDGDGDTDGHGVHQRGPGPPPGVEDDAPGPGAPAFGQHLGEEVALRQAGQHERDERREQQQEHRTDDDGPSPCPWLSSSGGRRRHLRR
jgi:hypothetical protein